VDAAVASAPEPRRSPDVLAARTRQPAQRQLEPAVAPVVAAAEQHVESTVASVVAAAELVVEQRLVALVGELGQLARFVVEQQLVVVVVQQQLVALVRRQLGRLTLVRRRWWWRLGRRRTQPSSLDGSRRAQPASLAERARRHPQPLRVPAGNAKGPKGQTRQRTFSGLAHLAIWPFVPSGLAHGIRPPSAWRPCAPNVRPTASVHGELK
jgi:hypothetical protein